MANPGAKVRTRTSATPSRPPRGFTLVELLVVISIGALLTVLVPIAYGALNESSQYRDTLRAMVSDMRTARQRALAEGREVRFAADLGNRTFGLQGASPRPLPQPLEMRATVAQIELQGNDVAAILFLPSGGATGGSIDVLRPSGAGTRLSVDWFSGQVTQSPVEP